MTLVRTVLRVFGRGERPADAKAQERLEQLVQRGAAVREKATDVLRQHYALYTAAVLKKR
jgi:hypothetical protein